MFSACREFFRAARAHVGRRPRLVGPHGYVPAIVVSVALLANLPALLAAAPSNSSLPAPSSPPSSARVLRVAADPNNLPFSNDRREGFENRIAELLADELGAALEYQWWPQRRGFFRETLGSGRADVVIGVPAGFERVLTTRAYYTSAYVFVQPLGDPALRSLDDPTLARLRIGVQLAGDDGNNTPPAHALARRGLVENVRGYTLTGDYAADSPPSAIVAAVARGEIDVALAWGPMAGFFASRQTPPLAVVPIAPCDCPGLPLRFSIAVGVARDQPALRDEIDAILARRSEDILRILDAYHVPRVEPASPRLAALLHAAR